MSNEENELIAQILDGDYERFGKLIDRYKVGLYYHCFKIVRDEDAAEDLAQDSFIQAYCQLHCYDGVHRFSTWLYKIATHKAIDYSRKHKVRPLDEAELAQIESQEPTAGQKAFDSELREAVDHLPAKYRSVISLYYWYGHDYQEIASLMNAPVGSIKGWMSRAKAMLKEALQ